MNETSSPGKPRLLREPLVRGLMLSLGLHLAVLAFVHPMPGSGMDHTLVINARLELEPTPEPLPSPTAPAPEENTKPALVQEDRPPPVDQPEPLPTPLSQSQPAPIQIPESPPSVSRQATAQDDGRTADMAPPPVQPALPSPATATSTNTSAPPTTKPAIPSPAGTTWYLARQVDRHPRAIGNIAPKYPELARQRGQEGTLKLRVKIDDLGRVREVEVVEAQPPEVFDEAALEAFREARFHPAMKDGRPVRYEAYMRVEFKLE